MPVRYTLVRPTRTPSYHTCDSRCVARIAFKARACNRDTLTGPLTAVLLVQGTPSYSLCGVALRVARIASRVSTRFAPLRSLPRLPQAFSGRPIGAPLASWQARQRLVRQTPEKPIIFVDGCQRLIRQFPGLLGRGRRTKRQRSRLRGRRLRRMRPRLLQRRRRRTRLLLQRRRLWRRRLWRRRLWSRLRRLRPRRRGGGGGGRGCCGATAAGSDCGCGYACGCGCGRTAKSRHAKISIAVEHLRSDGPEKKPTSMNSCSYQT